MAERNKDSSQSLLPRRFLTVTGYEIADCVLKFFNTKGFFKKKVEVVCEIPLCEVDNIESNLDELSVNWNGITHIFFKKNSNAFFFSILRDKVQVFIEEFKKNESDNKKIEILKKELTATTNSSVPFIDVCFDILKGLQENRVNWKQENEYSTNIGKNLIINNTSIPPISLDFTEVAKATSLESPTKVANECQNLLRSIYKYFQNLAVEDDLINKQHVRGAFSFIELYFCINDVFLGKVVKDTDNKEEFEYIEKLTRQLSENTNIKIEITELMMLFNKFDAEGEREKIVKDTRELVKIHLAKF